MITVYIDGACRSNPGRGGYAFAVYKDNKLFAQKAKGFALTTNNRMEISAFLYAMFYLHQEKLIQRGDTILFKTDSNYLKDSMTKWIKSWEKINFLDKKNPDLFRRCNVYRYHFNIQWEKVPAHSGVPGNELVDKLATQAADQPAELLFHDFIYELENPKASAKLKNIPLNLAAAKKAAAFTYLEAKESPEANPNPNPDQLQALEQQLNLLLAELATSFKANAVPKKLRKSKGVTQKRLKEINKEILQIFAQEKELVEKE